MKALERQDFHCVDIDVFANDILGLTRKQPTP